MRQYTKHNWFRQRLVAWSVPSHYLDQCWDIIDLTLGTNFGEILTEIKYISIQENAFENVVCEMAGISSRSQCAILAS